MTIDEAKARVAAATVHLTGKGGQGVLIPGGFILTAAHCVNWSHEGQMALGDYFIEDIETASGKSLKVQPLALEPVNDIAILGELDNQTFFDEAMAFEEFCNNTPAVPVCSDELESRKPFPVHILSHKGGWIAGQATRWGLTDTGMLAVEADWAIEGGTSGGPIVNEIGELVGIVSTSGQRQGTVAEDGCLATMPRPHLTMPVWLWNQVLEAMLPKDD